MKVPMSYAESGVLSLAVQAIAASIRRAANDEPVRDAMSDRIINSPHEALCHDVRGLMTALFQQLGCELLVLPQDADPATKVNGLPPTIDDDMDALVLLDDGMQAIRCLMKQIDAASESIGTRVIDDFVTRGVQSVNRKGKTFYLSTRRGASIRKENRQQAIKILEESGNDDLITVQPQTFSAWYKEKLEQIEKGEATEPIPAGLESLVEVYEKPTLAIRKA